MRVFIVVLGFILVRNGYVKVLMLGGCIIGSWLIDFYFKGLEVMGVMII